MSTPHKHHLPASIPSNAKVRVTSRGSVFHGNKTHLPGAILSADELPRPFLHEALLTGVVVPVESPDPVVVEEVMPQVTPEGKVQITGEAPNRDIPKPLFEKPVDAPIAATTSPGVSTVTTKPPPVTFVSLWTLNPISIQSRSLDQLNAMVLERDASLTPFQTREEAMSWLSQDFKPTA